MLRSTAWVSRWSAVLLLTAIGAAASCGGGDPPSTNGATGGSATESGGSTASGGSLESGGSLSGGASAQGGASNGAAMNAGGNAEVAGAAGAPEEGGASTATGGGAGEPGRTYPDITFTYDAGAEPPLTPDAACAADVVETVPIPLDLYVVLDRSGTMNLPQAMPIRDTTPGGGDCNVGDSTVSRWCYAINALDRFFGSTAAKGAGVALQFFPAGECTQSASPLLYACCNSGTCCQGATESAPDVPLAPLPAARATLVESLNAAEPWADRTPIEAALRGMIAYTKKAAQPGRQMMGLLITDGGPEGCQSSPAALAKLVKQHLAATGIPIYVVATQGAEYSALETIAAAGGAPSHTKRCAGGISPCHFYDVGDGNPAVFIDVLQQIRRAAIACSFEMPTTDTGLVDPSEVSLSMTPSSGASAISVQQVPSQKDCAATGGFFYDRPDAPTTLSLCPTTCDSLRAKDGGKVEILIGCRGS